MKYIIGNWKAHKTISQAKEWLETFKSQLDTDSSILDKLQSGKVTIIFCPPFHLLYLFENIVKTVPNFHLGVQNVSTQDEGSYTGEVTAKSLTGFAKYAIIGHSERRRFFHENNEDIKNKIDQCHKNGIQSILCIRGEHDSIFPEANFVAYEPQEAIGTGDNAPLDVVLNVKSHLNLPASVKFIYGGSVNTKNVQEYLSHDQIDGVLPGTASLDPHEFFSLIKHIT